MLPCDMKAKMVYLIAVLILVAVILLSLHLYYKEVSIEEGLGAEEIKLPDPSYEGKVSLEKTLHERRSRRDFTDQKLSLKELSQILWAAQGITSEWGERTAPSAAALPTED